MDKQEVIEKIEKLKGLNIKEKNLILDIEMIPKGDVLEIIEQLDEPVRPPEPKPLEPEKPPVPQYIADYIDSEQYSCSTLSEAIDNMDDEKEVLCWFYDNSETFAKAWLFGYEVKKEKLYTARLKLISVKKYSYINREKDEKRLFISDSDGLTDVYQTHFTQAELEELDVWNNPAFEIEEVEK